MFRVAHSIAIHLLIVALAVQPAVAHSVSPGCGSFVGSQFTCQDCGCCEVAAAEDRCDCCRGGSGAAVAEEVHSGCCGAEDETPNSSVLGQTAAENCGVTEQRPLARTTVAEPPSDEGNVPTQLSPVVRDTGAKLNMACSCFNTGQPIIPTAPRSSINKPRDHSPADCSESGQFKQVDGLADTRRSPFLRRHVALPSTQIAFCVWRL